MLVRVTLAFMCFLYKFSVSMIGIWQKCCYWWKKEDSYLMSKKELKLGLH